MDSKLMDYDYLASRFPEPSVKNLFAVNEFYRDNDDFINPDLQERLVIGDDSISIFTYDIKSNFFEIRDNIGHRKYIQFV
ncbi:Uncharacterised protein [Escherichia coli]|nr:Uncharacterised protein [Escherichia coli]